MFRTCAKFGVENGRNKGKTDTIKMCRLQKLARKPFSSFEHDQTKRI